MDRRQKSAVREAVVRFAVSSVIALLVLMVAISFLAGRIAKQEALRDARSHGYAIGNLVAAPLVNAKVRAHLAGASDELNAVMSNRMSDGSVLHIKLWDNTGEVIWSDEADLVGHRFPLDPDVKNLFGTQDVIAEVSNLSKAENRGERDLGELLEVYAGVYDSARQPMVFEAYFSAESMREDERAIFTGYMPIILSGLLLFQLAVLPLALSLARRVERGLAERSSWMRHALLASDLERRRIAQDLHDGVIQDLAGLCYVMPGLETQLAADPSAATAHQTAQRISGILRRDVAALRTMITDIYPPDLQGPGLATAIGDLARAATEHGLQVQIDIPPDLTVPTDTARLAYRVVREGLRNATKHARASAATIHIHQAGEHLFVTITDNGQGLQDDQGAHHTPGHLGLQLLQDAVRDFGGQITLQPGPAGGASLQAAFPIKLIQP